MCALSATSASLSLSPRLATSPRLCSFSFIVGAALSWGLCFACSDVRPFHGGRMRHGGCPGANAWHRRALGALLECVRRCWEWPQGSGSWTFVAARRVAECLRVRASLRRPLSGCVGACLPRWLYAQNGGDEVSPREMRAVLGTHRLR